MAAPEYVPRPAAEKPRVYESPPRRERSWLQDRPSELLHGQPGGGRFGHQGPDQGYALRLARHFEGQLVLTPGEHEDDVIAGCFGVATKRASLFGRAPVIHDFTVAFTVWGFLAEAPADLVALRRQLFESAHHIHHDTMRRTISDAVPEAVLRRTPAEVETAWRADWRSVIQVPAELPPAPAPPVPAARAAAPGPAAVAPPEPPPVVEPVAPPIPDPVPEPPPVVEPVAPPIPEPVPEPPPVVSEEPVVEPVVAEAPVVQPPVAVEPAVVEPVAVEPVAVEPVVVEPVAVEPVVVEPEKPSLFSRAPDADPAVSSDTAGIDSDLPIPVRPVAIPRHTDSRDMAEVARLVAEAQRANRQVEDHPHVDAHRPHLPDEAPDDTEPTP